MNNPYELMRKIFEDQNFKYKMSPFKIFEGVVQNVNYAQNTCSVTTSTGLLHEGVYLSASPTEAFTLNSTNQADKAYGVMTQISIGCRVIGVYIKPIEAKFIIKSLAPMKQIQDYNNDVSRGIKRIPENESDIREGDSLDEDIVKWGEVLAISSAMASIMLDYVGNIVSETEKQMQIRVGDRNADQNYRMVDDNNNEAFESEWNLGRIVEKDGDSNKIKTIDDVAVKKEYILRKTSGDQLKDIFHQYINADGKFVTQIKDTDGNEISNITTDGAGGVSVYAKETPITLSNDLSTITQHDTGDIEMTNDNCTVTLANDGTMTFDNGDTSFTIRPGALTKGIDIGESGEPAVKGNALQSFLGQILTYLSTHIHTDPLSGTTGPPSVLPPTDSGSYKSTENTIS